MVNYVSDSRGKTVTAKALWVRLLLWNTHFPLSDFDMWSHLTELKLCGFDMGNEKKTNI